MKYNRVEVFARAWRIAENSAVKFGGKASEYINEALRISWKIARLNILKSELFILNMASLSGGRTNTAAQFQISENNREIDRLTKEINALQADIYPTITVTETFDRLSSEERNSLIKRIAFLDRKINEAANPIEKFNYEQQHSKAKWELEESVRTYTRTVVDVNAYNDAA